MSFSLHTRCFALFPVSGQSRRIRDDISLIAETPTETRCELLRSWLQWKPSVTD